MKVSSFKNIVEAVFKRNGGLKRLKGELSVYYWPKVVGPEIAGSTEAKVFRNGYLYVQTENPSLAHQLSLFSSDIIKRYQKVLGFGVLQGIKVKIGSINGNVKNKTDIDLEVELSSQEQDFIVSNCKEIVDPLLAEKFAHFMERSLIRKRTTQLKGGSICQSCEVIIDKDLNYCPSCEVKVKQEIEDYLQYLKKSGIEVAVTSERQSFKIQNEHQSLMDQIMNSKKQEET